MAKELEVISHVPAAIAGDTEGAEKGILKTVIKVTGQAKANCDGFGQYSTGATKNSGFYKAEGLEGVSGFNTSYAVYVEFGTRKMSAQPFLRPAVDVVTKGATAKDAMIKAMNESVRRAL